MFREDKDGVGQSGAVHDPATGLNRTDRHGPCQRGGFAGTGNGHTGGRRIAPCPRGQNDIIRFRRNARRPFQQGLGHFPAKMQRPGGAGRPEQKLPGRHTCAASGHNFSIRPQARQECGHIFRAAHHLLMPGGKSHDPGILSDTQRPRRQIAKRHIFRQQRIKQGIGQRGQTFIRT